MNKFVCIVLCLLPAGGSQAQLIDSPPQMSRQEAVQKASHEAVTRILRRDRLAFSDIVDEAIRASPDLSHREKLRLRLLIAVSPRARTAISEACAQQVAEATANQITINDTEAAVNWDPDKLERLFQILIEYLPQLISIVMQVIELFAYVPASYALAA